MSGDVLDLVLIALASAFAVAGYRQGFIIGVLSFVGFTGGAVLGIYVAPGVAMAMTSRQNLQAVLAIIGVFAFAVIGMLISSALGVLLRSHVRGRPSTLLDSIGGAAVNVVAILVLAWLIGRLVAYAPPFPAIGREVNGSVLLRTVDRLIPVHPEFSALSKLLSTQPYVQVFGALGAETALNVPKLDPAVVHSAGLLRDRNSVVKIEGVAPSCSRTIEGTGFVISRDHVITNAHVVAGITNGPEVYTRFSSLEHPARVVLFDPESDIAVLYVPGLNLPALHLADSAPFGVSAVVAGYPLDASFTVRPARVGRSEYASGPDIYNSTRVVRDIYPIRAVVKPGNSGGPLIAASNGQVYGMVFAAAVAVPKTGYALTSSQLAGDIKLGEYRVSAAPTGACQ
ncbi:MAG TPA: MarP family serine protease [Streptosporangiaceae bacterium]|nr:MarP family serine protease [Streptosporangiaceae bacterium]